MMDFFVVDVLQSMFFADSNQNARPMTYYVERPYDIDEQFNRVAYSKGLFLLFNFCANYSLVIDYRNNSYE